MPSPVTVMLSICEALCGGDTWTHTFTKRGRWGIAPLLWASWVPIKYQKGQTGPLTSLFHENTSELKYSHLGTDLTHRPSQRRACQPRGSSSRLADLGTGPSVTSHFPVQTLSHASGNYWDPSTWNRDTCRPAGQMQAHSCSQLMLCSGSTGPLCLWDQHRCVSSSKGQPDSFYDEKWGRFLLV